MQFAKRSKNNGAANYAALLPSENKYLTGFNIARRGIGAQSAQQNALVPGRLVGSDLRAWHRLRTDYGQLGSNAVNPETEALGHFTTEGLRF